MEWLILLSLVGCAISSVCAAYVGWVSVKESKVVENNYKIYLTQIADQQKQVADLESQLVEAKNRMYVGDTVTGLYVTADRLFAVTNREEAAWRDVLKAKKEGPL